MALKCLWKRGSLNVMKKKKEIGPYAQTKKRLRDGGVWKQDEESVYKDDES